MEYQKLTSKAVSDTDEPPPHAKYGVWKLIATIPVESDNLSVQ